MFFVCRVRLSEPEWILASPVCRAQTDDVSTAPGDRVLREVRFFCQKTKKTTIRKGTIDSRCHPDSEKKLFSISADTILPLRSKPRDGMISPLCNVRETASDTRKVSFPLAPDRIHSHQIVCTGLSPSAGSLNIGFWSYLLSALYGFYLY